MAKNKRKNKSYRFKNSYTSKNNSSKYTDYSNENNSSTYNREDFSEEDIESLLLLEIQLRGTLIVIYGQLLLIQANFQGREVIYNKYKDNNDIDNSNTMLQVTPDKTVLKATYIFFLIKLLFIQIAFTRYNTVYNKKLNGEFPYSLEPNILINNANLLDLISCIYYIKAAEGILARDNNQPVFGI
ncbi:hypothetical protein [Clostridium cuniculi]|uniref:hypothetical protein n=1 Tax=Clostridium cuniculi TaxID=2548455 RepID=UPI001055755C|nr:hypothetical protein [Clostridium cuniculi]